MTEPYARAIVAVVVLLFAHDALWLMGVPATLSFAMVLGAGVASGRWIWR